VSTDLPHGLYIVLVLKKKTTDSSTLATAAAAAAAAAGPPPTLGPCRVGWKSSGSGCTDPGLISSTVAKPWCWWGLEPVYLFHFSTFLVSLLTKLSCINYSPKLKEKQI